MSRFITLAALAFALFLTAGVAHAQQTITGYNVVYTYTPSVCPGQAIQKQMVSFGTNVSAEEAGDIKVGLISLCNSMRMVPLPCKGANPVACGHSITPVTIP